MKQIFFFPSEDHVEVPHAVCRNEVPAEDGVVRQTPGLPDGNGAEEWSSF